jgi:hypothetical protein
VEAEETMSDKTPKQPPADEREPREVTPGGLEVRTPSRGEFFANLKKIIRPEK